LAFILVNFLKNLISAKCFKCFSAILESNVVQPSVKWNSWDYCSMFKNVQGIQLYSGYYHKLMYRDDKTGDISFWLPPQAFYVHTDIVHIRQSNLPYKNLRKTLFYSSNYCCLFFTAQHLTPKHRISTMQKNSYSFGGFFRLFKNGIICNL
jgi:hypothetical protein